MQAPHYAVLVEPEMGTTREGLVSADWNAVAAYVAPFDARYQIHHFPSELEAQQCYTRWMSQPAFSDPVASPGSFTSPRRGAAFTSSSPSFSYMQQGTGSRGGQWGVGGPGADVPNPRLAFEDEAHDDGPPAALPQAIQKTWLDAQVATLCPGKVLDPLQRRAVEEVVVRRSNVFLTGSGGVGKSFLSTLIIELLKTHYGFEYDMKVCVAASTGIASTHINGTTLHTATGIGVPRSWDHFGRMFGHDKKVDFRWSRHYEVLLVDEVSMLSAEMLEALDDTTQQVRRNARPFGGLQVIMVGDFAQLPPVPEDPCYNTNTFVPREQWHFPRHKECWHMPVVSVPERGNYSSGGRGKGGKQEVLFSNRGLALQADVWWDLDLHIIELTKVFRQDDEQFIGVLNRMRTGDMGRTDLEWVNEQFYTQPMQREQEGRQHLLQQQAADAARPESRDERLHLYPVNALVEGRNNKMMNSIQQPLQVYPAHDFVFVYHQDGSAIVLRGQSPSAHCGCDGRLERDLKLLQDNHTYYRSCLAAENVGLKLGAKVLLLKNLDLKGEKRLVNGSVGKIVGWAPKKNPFLDEIVDEKGEKFADVHVDGGGAAAEEEGQTTRQRERERDMIAYKERKVKEWYRTNGDRIPMVEFTCRRRKAIGPELFSENIVGVGSCCRIQLPLMIAFAISIHKSQGMTLQEAVVDVQRSFEGGQSYVALSRVGPREGLRLAHPLQARSIMVNPTFLLWNRLRKAMELRRATLLSLLLAAGQSAEHDHVARLGLKGLHHDASLFLNSDKRKQDASVELKKAYAALKSSLDCLKPVRDETKKVTRIVHWQMLDWWKQRHAADMKKIYTNKRPAAGQEEGKGKTCT